MTSKNRNGALTKLHRNPPHARTLLLNAFLNHFVSSHGHILQTSKGESRAWPKKRSNDAGAIRCKLLFSKEAQLPKI